MASTRKPSIKDYVDGQDLREINWRRETLHRLAKEYQLQPGECVAFENARRNKGRLVVNIGGLIGVFIPPIDPARQLSVHLEINEFLRGLSGTADVTKRLYEGREDIAARLERRKKMKEKARRRRVKEKKQ